MVLRSSLQPRLTVDTMFLQGVLRICDLRITTVQQVYGLYGIGTYTNKNTRVAFCKQQQQTTGTALNLG